ncbi:MAG: succinic semialdehyde dehydrogenase [Microthrixaceae bacterium]
MGQTTTNVSSSSSSTRSLGRTAGRPASLTTSLLDRLTALISNPSGQAVKIIAPFSGEAIVELPQCTADDVLSAASEAREAQLDWARMDVRSRAGVFLRLHDLVFANSETLMDLIQAENGKARRDAFLEVADIANTCRYYARKAPGLLDPNSRRGLIPMLTSVTELHHPKGLVTIISPWNYPLSLGAGDTIPALLAGNAVIQKPDNQTALTTLFMLELMTQAGLPAGVWQVVTGRGSAIGDTLLDVADYVMFTGSTESGRHIAAEAGRRLVDCSAELGGKNPVLILDDANLDRAVEGAVRACFSSSGQLCISGERMYVADAIWDRFVPRFVDAVKALRIGGSYDFEHNMGSLTSESQLRTVETHVEDAVSKGAKVLAGGKARPDLGPFFYEPTVLSDVEESMTCFAEETFGPVVSLYRFKTDDEAIAAANDTTYGLNSSVWSSSPTRGRAVAARLKTGTVNVNEAYAAAWGSIDAPMGGMGASGIGRRHGEGGLLKYTESQTVAYQRMMNLAPPLGLGDEAFAKVMSAALKVMKKAGLS